MGVEDLVLEPREGQFYLGFKQEIFRTDVESDLVRLIFGPLKASDLKAFDPNTAAVDLVNRTHHPGSGSACAT